MSEQNCECGINLNTDTQCECNQKLCVYCCQCPETCQCNCVLKRETQMV